MTSSTELFASRRHTRVATLVHLVEETLRAADPGAKDVPRQAEPVAAVLADWGRSAPVYAALTAYAHAYRGRHDEGVLAIGLPNAVRPDDHAAVDILLDSLCPEDGKPRVVLMTTTELNNLQLDLVFRPQHDDSDLLALAAFGNALHQRAQEKRD